MASNPPTQPPWLVAVRFLTLGTLFTSTAMLIWLISRVADRLDAQTSRITELDAAQHTALVSIQRDILINQSQVAAVLAAADQGSRRLINVEERVGRAAEDRQAMREFDQQMTEALIRLRGTIDQLRERIDEPPPDDEPGPKTRLRR